MKQITNSELSILGLVAEGPKHGYQIEQDILARGMREWTEIGFSSIYYILNKLEEAGCLESERQDEGDRPARKIYHLTESGWQAYREAVRRVLSSPHARSGDFDLGLANFTALPKEDGLAAVRQYRDGLEERLKQVRQRWERDRQMGAPAHVNTLFEHSLAGMQFELDWLGRFIKDLEKE